MAAVVAAVQSLASSVHQLSIKSDGPAEEFKRGEEVDTDSTNSKGSPTVYASHDAPTKLRHAVAGYTVDQQPFWIYGGMLYDLSSHLISSRYCSAIRTNRFVFLLYTDVLFSTIAQWYCCQEF